MEFSSDTLRRYSLAVLVHVLLVVAWYLFVKLGDVPKYVMPTPGEAFMALFTGNYGWWQNVAVTGTEIFGGYFLALFFGVGLALLFTWSRWLEELAMPALVSLNMIPKVALGPLIIVWFKYCSRRRAACGKSNPSFSTSCARCAARAGSSLSRSSCPARCRTSFPA
jgi:NitT/TauT family transport system permease protein